MSALNCWESSSAYLKWSLAILAIHYWMLSVRELQYNHRLFLFLLFLHLLLLLVHPLLQVTDDYGKHAPFCRCLELRARLLTTRIYFPKEA